MGIVVVQGPDRRHRCGLGVELSLDFGLRLEFGLGRVSGCRLIRRRPRGLGLRLGRDDGVGVGLVGVAGFGQGQVLWSGSTMPLRPAPRNRQRLKASAQPAASAPSRAPGFSIRTATRRTRGSSRQAKASRSAKVSTRPTWPAAAIARAAAATVS